MLLPCTNEPDLAGTKNVIGNLFCSRRMGIVLQCHPCAGSSASRGVHRAEGSCAGHGRNRMGRAWLPAQGTRLPARRIACGG
jgi:hypothetical protein